MSLRTSWDTEGQVNGGLVSDAVARRQFVGHSNYLDNAVHKLWKQDYISGVDILCVFNYLNYINNLKLSVYVAGSSSGFVEDHISRLGEVSDPNKGKYGLACRNFRTCTLTILKWDSISTYWFNQIRLDWVIIGRISTESALRPTLYWGIFLRSHRPPSSWETCPN